MNPRGVYHIEEIPCAKIHPSIYQPKGRTGASSALDKLITSIKDIDLQYPPLVTKRQQDDEYDMIDGHRRLAAVQLLGWAKIPCLVSMGHSASEVFSGVTGTTKPLTAANWVSVYLAGGTPPSGNTKTCINRLDSTMGREFLEKLVEHNLSPTIWAVANRMINYVGRETLLNGHDGEYDPIVDVLDWLFEHRITREVSAWINPKAEYSKSELILAFKENRPPSTLH